MKPNIILIMCDQMNWKTGGFAGNAHVRTPRLDRLAREGVYFENAYCASPVCSPARASWMTGLYPHAHHLFTLWVEPGIRDAFMGKLQEQGIGVAVNYRPVHLLSYYRQAFAFKKGAFPEAERIGASTLSLPLYPQLSEDDVSRVIEAVKRAAGFRSAVNTHR